MRIRKIAVVLLLGAASMARAQTGGSWSVDGTVGGATGRGGEFDDRSFLGGRLALSRRTLVAPKVGYFAELAQDWVALNVGEDAVCRTSSRGGCQPSYPKFSGPELSGGLLLRPDGMMEFRVGIGAGALSAPDGPRVGAIVASADFAGFMFDHVGIVVGARELVVPSYRHDKLAMVPLAFGLRIR